MTSALRQEGRLWRWCRKGYERLRPLTSSRWFYVLVLVSTIVTLLQFVDMRSMRFVQILSNIGASFQGSTPSETLRWNTNHDRWIVIDVTSGRSCPSRDLTEAPPGWWIILSGETTHECVFPKCRMSSFQNKGNNKERGKGLSPINHAYMEAISLGAETVITVDCMAPMSLSEIVHLLTEQRSQSTVSRSQSTASSHGLPRHSKDGKYRERGLMYNSTTLFNAYAHFGARTGVPRAFHSTRQVVEPNSRHYYVRDFHRVFVVHALSDASDDLVETRTRERDETLDGVSQQKQPWTAGHRRRRRASQDSPNPDSKQADSRGERHGMRFEPWTPPVFVGQRTLTPVVPASSLYTQRGLWALAAPCLHPRWRCEILRQMITQRMLGELDAFTAFYPISAAGQEDNNAGRKLVRRAPIEVLPDDSHHQAPDFDVMELATFLNSWTCEKSLTFFQCYGLLVDQLHSKRFLHLPSRLQTVNWLGSLREANVSEPTRMERPWRGVKKVGEVEVVLQATSVDALVKEEKQVERLQRGLGDKVKERCTKPIVQKQNNNVKNNVGKQASSKPTSNVKNEKNSMPVKSIENNIGNKANTKPISIENNVRNISNKTNSHPSNSKNNHRNRRSSPINANYSNNNNNERNSNNNNKTKNNHRNRRSSPFSANYTGNNNSNNFDTKHPDSSNSNSYTTALSGSSNGRSSNNRSNNGNNTTKTSNNGNITNNNGNSTTNNNGNSTINNIGNSTTNNKDNSTNNKGSNTNTKNDNPTTNGSITNTSLPYIKPPNLPSISLWSAPLLEDIVLVVVFNNGGFFMDNLPFLETVHRPYFRHIFYCVPNVQDILSKAKLRKEENLLKHVNLVEGLSDGWFLMYECVTSVIRIGLPSVRGYLHIGDDTLVNNWKLPDTPLDQVLTTDNNDKRLDAHVQKYWWVWWKTSMGRPALIAALAGLERISGLTLDELRDLNSLDDRSGFNQSDLPGGMNNATTSPSKNVTWVSYMSLDKKMREDKTVQQPRLFGGTEEWEEPTQEDARRFLRNYYLSNRRTNFLGFLAMDIFYLPHRRSSDFALFSRYFMRHVIMDEMAIPNLVFGISERWGISTFSGKELWGADRHVLSKFYKKENTFIHPFKLSGDVKNEIGRTFFCETYLDDLYTEWKKQIQEKKQV